MNDHSAETKTSVNTTLLIYREEIITLWFQFPEATTGASVKIKCQPHVRSKPNILSPNWVPMYKKVVKITLTKAVSLHASLCYYHLQVTRWDV